MYSQASASAKSNNVWKERKREREKMVKNDNKWNDMEKKKSLRNEKTKALIRLK